MKTIEDENRERKRKKILKLGETNKLFQTKQVIFCGDGTRLACLEEDGGLDRLGIIVIVAVVIHSARPYPHSSTQAHPQQLLILLGVSRRELRESMVDCDVCVCECTTATTFSAVGPTEYNDLFGWLAVLVHWNYWMDGWLALTLCVSGARNCVCV